MNGDVFVNSLLKEFGGITQGKLAKLLGKNTTQISNLRKVKNVSPLTVARMMAGLNRQIVRGDDLVIHIKEKFEVATDFESAQILGVTQQSLSNWKARNTGVTKAQIANAVAAARTQAKKDAHKATLRPIIEFFPLDAVESRGGAKYELFPTGKDDNSQHIAIRKCLESTKGIYVFYDTRGRAIYAGKAKSQSLWSELKNVFNRDRKTQLVYRVDHPERNLKFAPAYDKARRIRKTQLELSDIAAYLSVYEVDPQMINSLEALLVRGFANDLLNVRMEKFDNHKSTRKAPTVRMTAKKPATRKKVAAGKKTTKSAVRKK